MAISHEDEILCKCSVCRQNLDFDSKTLPCLHSICVSCVDKNFKGLRDGETGHCPECQESVKIGQMTLSTIVTKTLRRQRLEMNPELQCDLCSESVARNWCHECQKLICNNCNRVHKKLLRDHQLTDLSGMTTDKAVELMTSEFCHIHLKTKNYYCQVCDNVSCDTCHKSHPSDSPGCSPLHGLSSAKSISPENECILQGLNPVAQQITAMHISKEDNHIFLCASSIIMEFTEGGEFVCKCLLREGMISIRPLHPSDICSMSSNLLVVVAGWGVEEDETFIHLERKPLPPFLEIKKICMTGRKFSGFSPRLCERKGKILVCDDSLNIDLFSKEGNKIKTIKTGESGSFFSIIRADPSNGNFWLAKELDYPFFRELFCFDEKGRQIHSMKIEEEILDLSFSEFGNFFCNWEGIFSFYPEKKIFYKFEKESEKCPKIFVLRNKVFIYLRINGKDLVKIFKIFD